MRFDREVLQQIRDRVDMVELVNSYTHLERRGDRWWGLSPFKPEKTPSFTVKPAEGFYYCFATNQGGDLFKFVSEMEGLSFPEAVQFLAERAGVGLEDGGGPTGEDRERIALLELYSRVQKSFHYLLTEEPRGQAALSYIERRGVSREAIDRFNLGFAPDSTGWLYQFLQRHSYSRDFLDRSGLFSRRYPGFPLFRNRLMFPISDERGRVVAFGGRALADQDRAKYINSPETPIYNKKRTLYGLSLSQESLRKTRRAYVAEGYLDVIALHQAGVENAVAPLGTAFTEEQARLLKRWVGEVCLVFDADTAGVNASLKAAMVAERVGLSCLALVVPSGKDPAELYANHGAAAVQEMVEQARPVYEHLLEALVSGVDETNSQERELLLQRIFPYITIINSEVRREAALEQLSATVGASVRAVMSDFERWRRGEQPQRFERRPEGSPTTYSIGRDVALMLATAQDGGLFAYLRSRVGPDDLTDKTARQLYLFLEDAFRHEDELPRGLIDRISDENLRNAVLEKLTSGEYAGWTRDDVERAVDRIRIRALEEQQRHVEVELKRLSNDDGRHLRELLERKMAIDQELGNLKVRADD